MLKPDFVGIGFRRCGTSWLNDILSDHPRISKPPNGLHYFSEHHERGPAWYSAQLRALHRPGTIVGDFSTTYSYPEVVERAAGMLAERYPDVKLVVSLREPADRAYSDFRRGVVRGETPPGRFGDALAAQPELVERGRYATMLRPYLDRFPRAQVHVIRYDDIEAEPEVVVRRLYRFLGVDENHEPALLRGSLASTRFVDPAAPPPTLDRFPWLRESLKLIGPVRHLVRRLRRTRTIVTARPHVVERGIPEDDLPALHRLAEAYREEIEALRELALLDVEPWLNRYPAAGGDPGASAAGASQEESTRATVPVR